MIQKLENCKENGEILIKNAGENRNFEKHAGQNTVATGWLEQRLLYQIVAIKILGNVTMFGGVCFNI